MNTVFIIVLFMVYSIWRELLWHSERKDLYNRLMARDLTEYREEKKPIPPPKAPVSKFVAILRRRNAPRKGGD